MPQYLNTPFKPTPPVLVSGILSYLYGSWSDRVGPTQGFITADSATGTVATVTFKITSGNIPAVGSSISVSGAARSNNLNVTNAQIQGISIPDGGASGVVTVTYQITSTSLAPGADGGTVFVAVPEIAEAMQNGSSSPVAVPTNPAAINQGRILTATVTFPALPAAAIVTLQEALQDIDSEYTDVATVAIVSGSSTSSGSVFSTSVEVSGRFYRFHTKGLVGTGSIIGKIEG